jgi:putative FmdB family regulatory protein
MPFYEYQCEGCSNVFEVRATIKEKEAGLKLACPKCGGRKVRQRLTAAVGLRGGPKSSPPTCGPNSGPGCCG